MTTMRSDSNGHFSSVAGHRRARGMDRSWSLNGAIWIAFLAQAWNSILGTTTIAFIGSYNFTVGEVVTVVALIAFIDGVARYGVRWGIIPLAAGLFVALSILNFLRGMTENASSALVSARTTIPFAALLMLCLVRYPRAELAPRLEKALSTVSLLLVVIVLFRALLGPQFLMVGGDTLNVLEINDGGRPLPAFGALMLAVAATIKVSHVLGSKSSSRRDGAQAALIVLGLVLSGQGTAIACGAVSIATVWVLHQARGFGLRPLTAGAFVVLAAVATLIVSAAGTDALKASLPEAIAGNLERREANLGTRQTVWSGAINAYTSGRVIDQAIGWPTGSAPAIVIVSTAWGKILWGRSVHSMYIGTLLGVGMLGLASFIVMIIALLTKGLGLSLTGRGAVPLALVFSVCFFSYTYSLPQEMALIIAYITCGLDAGYAKRGTL